MSSLPDKDSILEFMKGMIESGGEVSIMTFLLTEDDKVVAVPAIGSAQDTMLLAVMAIKSGNIPPVKGVLIGADTWHSSDSKFLENNPDKHVRDDPNRSEALMVSIYFREGDPQVEIHPYLRDSDKIIWDPDVIGTETGDFTGFGGGLDQLAREALSTNPDVDFKRMFKS